MFEREIKINQFIVTHFEKIVADISEQAMFQPSPGHGHPPVWIMGHLAICGEIGQKYLGGVISHHPWLEIFGPGSIDTMVDDGTLGKHELAIGVVDAYAKFREMAVNANLDTLQGPHGIPFFRGTPIETVADCLSLLLTNHFAFHLAQLSSCRRSAGFPHLF